MTGVYSGTTSCGILGCTIRVRRVWRVVDTLETTPKGKNCIYINVCILCYWTKCENVLENHLQVLQPLIIDI